MNVHAKWKNWKTIYLASITVVEISKLEGNSRQCMVVELKIQYCKKNCDS